MVGITLAVYGVTEILHGYGFLAVFVAAVTLRHREASHEFHGVMHHFADNLERIASLLFLLLLGGVFVVRPLAGWIGLLGSSESTASRTAIARSSCKRHGGVNGVRTDR